MLGLKSLEGNHDAPVSEAKSGAERRRHYRMPVRRTAELLLQPGQKGYDCTVLDESVGGLQVEFESGLELPEEVTIRFSDDVSQLVRRCWSRGTRAGFQYIEAEAALQDALSNAPFGNAAEAALALDFARIQLAVLERVREEMDVVFPTGLVRIAIADATEAEAVHRIATGTEMLRLFGYRQLGRNGAAAPAELGFFGSGWESFVLPKDLEV